MALRIPFKYSRTLSLAKPILEVEQFIVDYRHSIPACFPGLNRFEAATQTKYFWEFNPLKYAGKTVVVHFYTRFSTFPHGLKVIPEGSREETHLSGEWRLTPAPSGCALSLDFELELNVPLPSLMRGMIAPLAEQELNKLFDHYAENIATHFAE